MPPSAAPHESHHGYLCPRRASKRQADHVIDRLDGNPARFAAMFRQPEIVA